MFPLLCIKDKPGNFSLAADLLQESTKKINLLEMLFITTAIIIIIIITFFFLLLCKLLTTIHARFKYTRETSVRMRSIESLVELHATPT